MVITKIELDYIIDTMRVKKISCLNPTENFKLSIRNKHRQQIRKAMMTPFYNLQALQLCLSKLEPIINKIIKQQTGNQNFHNQQQEQKKNLHKQQRQIEYWNRWQRHHKYKDEPKYLHYISQAVESVSNIIKEVDYIFNDISIQLIQQTIKQQINQHKQQSTSAQINIQPNSFNIKSNPNFYFNFKQNSNLQYNNYLRESNCVLLKKISKFIQIYIPLIVFIMQQVQFDQNQFRYIANSHSRQPFCNINVQKTLKTCIQIICKLSCIPYLSSAYTFPQNSSDGYYSDFAYQQFVYSKLYQLQPMRLIARQLFNFLDAQKIFYQCLIAVANLLQHRLRNNLYQDDPNTDNIQKINQHYYQILLQSDLEEIFAGVLASSGNTTSGKQNKIYKYKDNSTEVIQDNCQQILIWSLYIYTRFLSANQFPIFTNHLILSQLQPYIEAKLQTYHNENNGALQQREMEMSEHGRKILKYIILLIEYCQIKLDNSFIINTVIPILRSNWCEPYIAKLWLHLTFKGDYAMSQLLIISNSQDKKTVKRKKLLKQQQQQSQLQQQSPVTNKEIYTIHPLYYIFNQIFQIIRESISNLPSMTAKITRNRNIDLIEGIYNIILQIQQASAIKLWQDCYNENIQIQNKIKNNQDIRLWQIVQKIEKYCENIRQ